MKQTLLTPAERELAIQKKLKAAQKAGLTGIKITGELLAREIHEAIAQAQLEKDKWFIKEVHEELEKCIESLCSWCKRLNPQHKDCTSCEEVDGYRQTLAKIKGG